MWRLAPTGQLPAPPELSRRDYLSLCVTSAFPGIYNLTLRQQYRWLGNFVERILSKDAGDITGINHPDRLELLLQVLAAENSSETVAATMSRNIDIPERSIPTYIQALRQVFLVKQLPGWSSNTTKKAISRKKTTLVDVGLAAFLSGADVDGLERAISSTTTGGLVEGFVVGELSRQLSWSKIDAKLYHFRDSQKNEVDIVLENRKREIVGLEVKAATSIGKSDFKGLEFLRDAVGDRFVSGAVLYTGTNALPFGDRLWALPISTIWSI
jgi:predicted AAA+ superfamily ATPase